MPRKDLTAVPVEWHQSHCCDVIVNGALKNADLALKRDTGLIEQLDQQATRQVQTTDATLLQKHRTAFSCSPAGD